MGKVWYTLTFPPPDLAATMIPSRSPRVLGSLLLVFASAASATAQQSAVTRPFNGKNLDGWVAKQPDKNLWTVTHPVMSTKDRDRLDPGTGDGPAAMVNLAPRHGAGTDIYSKARFGDCRIELEVMVPQGSNSGIYVMGEYEVQVLDSYGRTKLGMGDMGAIYGAAAPRVNASRAPGKWQQYVIDFKAPRFAADGGKTADAKFLRVELNGVVIQENADMKGATPGGVTGVESATGPLMFQGNHGPVAYRNIVISPLPGPEKSLAIPETDEGLPGAGPIRRYKWFEDLWIRRRTAWRESAAKDRNALVFLGDSITQGWGPKLAAAFPGVKVANRGISGDTTRGMLIRLQEDVLDLHPRGVVILAGTNDLEEKASPRSVADNTLAIVKRLKAHDPKMPIILCRVFPSSASKRRPAAAIQRINALCAAAVNGDPQVTVLDTWTLFADDDGNAKKAEFPDLLHPNAVGYAKWAAALRPLLATHGFLEIEPDAFEPESGFTSLFNGSDLTGWGFRERKTLRPLSEFDGSAQSNDGRYVARNGRLVVTTPPEGRRVQQLWTTREFAGDFVLKLEFRATPNADSGVFIRGRQLQCRDYPLAGPYRKLEKYRAQDWNELVITVRGRSARCTCNGEVLEAAFEVPASGPIGLEGDRGQMEYRRIRVSEGG